MKLKPSFPLQSWQALWWLKKSTMFIRPWRYLMLSWKSAPDHCLGCVSDAQVLSQCLNYNLVDLYTFVLWKPSIPWPLKTRIFSRSHTTLPQCVCLWSKCESLALFLQALRILNRGGERFNATLMLFHQSSFGKYSRDILFLMVEQL